MHFPLACKLEDGPQEFFHLGIIHAYLSDRTKGWTRSHRHLTRDVQTETRRHGKWLHNSADSQVTRNVMNERREVTVTSITGNETENSNGTGIETKTSTATCQVDVHCVCS